VEKDQTAGAPGVPGAKEQVQGEVVDVRSRVSRRPKAPTKPVAAKMPAAPVKLGPEQEQGAPATESAPEQAKDPTDPQQFRITPEMLKDIEGCQVIQRTVRLVTSYELVNAQGEVFQEVTTDEFTQQPVVVPANEQGLGSALQLIRNGREQLKRRIEDQKEETRKAFREQQKTVRREAAKNAPKRPPAKVGAGRRR
jgi:hypothetical protein